MAIDTTKVTSFEEEVKELRLERRLSGHPFVKMLLGGEATREQMKVFAVQWYFHTVVFPTTLGNLLSRCRIRELRAGLAEGLYEEETGEITKTKPHVELYYDFLETLDISRDFIDGHGYLLPGMAAVVNWYQYCTTALDPLVGIAALTVAAEGQNVTLPGDPGLSGLISQGLREHFGAGEKGLKFWDLHDYADQEHSGAGVRLLARFAVTETQQAQVRAAIRLTQDCMWAAFDDLLKYTWEDSIKENCAPFYWG
jgi:pyrroloquinoline-quinone synthase